MISFTSLIMFAAGWLILPFFRLCFTDNRETRSRALVTLIEIPLFVGLLILLTYLTK